MITSSVNLGQGLLLRMKKMCKQFEGSGRVEIVKVEMYKEMQRAQF